MITIRPDARHPVFSLLSILASSVFGARRVRFFSAKPQAKLLADLASCVDRSAIRPVVDAFHPLAEIAAAHRAMEGSGRRGKQVVRLS